MQWWIKRDPSITRYHQCAQLLWEYYDFHYIMIKICLLSDTRAFFLTNLSRIEQLLMDGLCYHQIQNLHSLKRRNKLLGNGERLLPQILMWNFNIALHAVVIENSQTFLIRSPSPGLRVLPNLCEIHPFQCSTAIQELYLTTSLLFQALGRTKRIPTRYTILHTLLIWYTQQCV